MSNDHEIKKGLSRREFLARAGAGAAGLLAASVIPGRLIPGMDAAFGQTGASGRKPNVVVILADDLGYGELGMQGNKDIPTPNIDSIATNGIRFTNGYVSCPVCSPTRAGLLTGRYQQRFGHELNPGPPETASEAFGLPLSQKTIANYMKEQGYATGIVGKWHQGYEPRYHPMKRGFDEFFGFLAGAHPYLDSKGAGPNAIMRGTQPVDEPAYLTDAFAREAVAFINKHKAEPFFLYLAFNAVHSPLQSIQKYLDRFSGISDQKRRTFAAMQSAMDDAVGSVLTKLREDGLEENTLVIFLSDNGGPTKSTTSGNGPLSGFKGDTLEGGIRIPYAVQWKGRIPAGKVYDQPVISLDILPTAVAVAGGQAGPNVEGVDLMPYLTGGKSGNPHDALYWRYGEKWAVRRGDWKLVNQDGSVRLYNLADDIGESKDLSTGKPDKVKELRAAYDAWNSHNIAPLWKTQREKKNAGNKDAKGGKKNKQK